MNRRDYECLGSFNILYLEDEIDLLKHTTEVLIDFVHKIYAVQTCEEALKIIKTKKVDVIISDILLKNGNGIEFLQDLRDKGYNIPAILTTAYTDTEYLLDAIKLKVENYIVKPINIKELLNSLHDVLLPKIQSREIRRSYNIIKTISAITDGKQVDIIKFIFNNLDDDNMLNYSYSDIMERVDVSKPTVIKLFKQLLDLGIFSKIQNGKYCFNENYFHLQEANL
ncbi:MAG: response regulator [Sulfurospirillaceae bacterium]|jgi:response regulator RpfG family c-di-GMP phosphodiesterase|nr:response regulator [Sulfurospirillaceae bacterium]MCK9546667.1 response regulator [Sulfurospirillaceae bacterium]MDY0237755.1 response regulator [Campylobacterales bacterium]NLM99604.1 response regulator transcription factor [Campylobacteraceae bacterium]